MLNFYKKSQISFFIIIGLVFLVSVSALMFFGNTKQIQNFQSSDLGFLRDNFRDCLEDVSNEGVLFVSIQGGYYDVPGRFIGGEEIKVPYYVYDDEQRIPSPDSIEKEIQKYVNQNIFDCFLAEEHKKNGVSFNGNLNIDVKINEDEIKFTLSEKFSASKGDTEVSLGDNGYSILTYYPEYFNNVEKFYRAIKNDTSMIPITDISDIAYDGDFTYDIISEDENLLYMLIFNNTGTLDSPLVFMFAVKISLIEEEENVEIKETFYIVPPPMIIINSKEKVSYQLNASSDDVEFYTESSIIEVSEDGLLTIDPSKLSFDRHSFFVSAENSDGYRDTALINVYFNKSIFAPVIKDIGELEGKIGEEFNFKVELENSEEDVLFSSDTELFEIDPTEGIISFIPKEIGEYIVTIVVANEFGESKKDMRLLIK